MNVLDLFSGIGGFSLGLERAGMRTVAFCEVKPFARRVLAERWPNVPCYGDVRELSAARLKADGIVADVICGGFPCQDISSAGKGAGIDGTRSGLWSEYARLIGEIRPRYVVVENVAALLGRGLDRVLGDLASLGYDAEWDCVPASAIGARHRRDRIWIVGYPSSSAFGRDARAIPRSQEEECREGSQHRDISDGLELASSGRSPRAMAHPNEPGQQSGRGPWISGEPQEARHDTWRRGSHVADAERQRLQGRDVERTWAPAIIPAAIGWHCRGGELGKAWWTEPDVGRMAYGVPNGMDRIEGLGNAVVPQIPEIIGRAIMRAAE